MIPAGLHDPEFELLGQKNTCQILPPKKNPGIEKKIGGGGGCLLVWKQV